jgi:maltose alpha-D-glucosyltransferase/alpha-amylase
VIDKGPYGYEHVNAAEQRRDANSMLNWTERIIRMRKEVPEVSWGDFEVIDTGTASVFAIRYDWRDNSVLFLHNLDPKPREISFHPGLPDGKGDLLVSLLTDQHSHAGKRGRHDVLLEPFGYRWYRVGGLDYLLRRSDIEVKAGRQEASSAG